MSEPKCPECGCRLINGYYCENKCSAAPKCDPPGYSSDSGTTVGPLRFEDAPKRIFEAYKEQAQGMKYTPKQIMENMLTNWIDGITGEKKS